MRADVRLLTSALFLTTVWVHDGSLLFTYSPDLHGTYLDKKRRGFCPGHPVDVLRRLERFLLSLSNRFRSASFDGNFNWQRPGAAGAPVATYRSPLLQIESIGRR